MAADETSQLGAHQTVTPIMTFRWTEDALPMAERALLSDDEKLTLAALRHGADTEKSIVLIDSVALIERLLLAARW